MNNNYYIVFDLETDSPDPSQCNIVEIAAVAVNPRTLAIEQESFKITVKPEGIDDPSYFTEDRLKTIDWHAKTRGVTRDDIINLWKNGTEEKVAWKNFVMYCNKYNLGNNKDSSFLRKDPIPVGYNIINFDIPIIKRYAAKFKDKMPFSEVWKVDVMDELFLFFENLQEPKNLKMDTVRDFFGIQSAQAHEALSDVMDEAQVFVRFLKFIRSQSRVEKFKGAFKCTQ